MSEDDKHQFFRTAYDPTRPPPTKLILSRELLEEMTRHLRDWLPFEGCGLLAVDTTGVGRRFYPGDNVDRSPVRFTMDPAAVVAALREMDTEGWHLGAIVHSHPGTAATPSATDLREAHYPSALMMIASFEHDQPEFRLWAIGITPGEPGVNAGERQLVLI